MLRFLSLFLGTARTEIFPWGLWKRTYQGRRISHGYSTGAYRIQPRDIPFQALELPCGVVLKNPIAKAAMSDSLGSKQMPEPAFRKFSDAAESGITAWYAMRLTDIGAGRETDDTKDIVKAISNYEPRDDIRTEIWSRHFGRSFRS